ncbi:MAG: hypothetical protein COS14_11485 [Bacteroidetes bacterium CG02_land_8_20_14_3_00_31_25]|nr:hypothetical protein [Bacteroidota bacterium]PIV58086.1 MAG: hypothetical protein COS14_11485 [Bacteroidetes bacterium CG02_land_8_20_14_3_00_31_25]PIX36353.1 MAG: hypothetical protein COZ59_01540 [Bacteroidetes bacterium CG_4_8_14_3_um_filter_31_14]PIY03894.1 MAG: hypothetical protein COZ21_08070 [Bacteroidetes bacterium CG_4_10_14_3_um_filter_31_20]
MTNNKKEKIKNFIKNTKIDKKYISGIYNYCDRWCERCSFTGRCLSFSFGEELNLDNKEIDITNKKFWDNLSLIFQATSELLIEKANELGIDLNKKVKTPKKITLNKLLLKLSKDYSVLVTKWIQENYDNIKIKADFYSNTDSKKLIKLKDAIEVINWYSMFIHVKLHRALVRDKEEFDPEFAETDSNGSAKTTLIAIDRSIESFVLINNILTEYEDDSLKFLSMLSRVRKMTEQTFPQARHFIRAGLDE